MDEIISEMFQLGLVHDQMVGLTLPTVAILYQLYLSMEYVVVVSLTVQHDFVIFRSLMMAVIHVVVHCLDGTVMVLMEGLVVMNVDIILLHVSVITMVFKTMVKQA